MILATDIGYGHTKYAFNNTLGKFPSVVAPIYIDSEISGYGESKAVEYNGRKYLIGQDGIYEKNIVVTGTEEFLIRYSPLLIHKVFQINDIKQVDLLCVSLSIAEFHEKKEKMKEVCSSFMINGTAYRQNVNVYPQGLGIWVDMGKPSNAIIIDIGFNTVDVITFLDGRPIRDYSFGIMNQGVNNITGIISDYLNGKFPGTYIGHEFANEILLNGGRFTFMRREYDISDFVNYIKEDYTKNTINMVTTSYRIQKVLNRINTYIVAGGGGYYIDKQIQKKYGLQIPYKPEYSNVRGFLKEAQESLK